ncbi:uncharacterized protein [Rutidosis leptorrhynchoides]|uniref:uncharacterized protein n=1 Tax=Rutidosis leptorrhynchoides TaxID=125765 RepID=UPI003A98CF37
MTRFLCLFIIVMLVPLGPVLVLNAKPIGTRLDLLESTGNNTHWDEKSILIEHLARITYVNSIINMAGVILFGPEKAQSILRYKLIKLQDHDRQCLESTYKLFLKHCGEIESDSINRLRSFGNMCSFVADKAKIKEAFIISCGTNNTEPSVIDKENPSIEIIPAPVHGTSDYYCGRVSVKGISRMKPWSYAKEYRVRVSPSPIVRDESYSKIHLCFHRNATLGLCQCENYDWISIKKRLQSSRMSPYEHSFVDVKVDSGAFGDVMVIYDEVSRRGRYQLLFGGIGLLFLAPIASKEFFPGVASRGAQFSKWCMLILGVTCILHSSFDTPLAIVAAASCLSVYYVIFSIMWRDD